MGTNKLEVIGSNSVFTISHDYSNRCINIKYGESIVDMREVVSERFATVFDVNLGAICSFVKGQLENYCKDVHTSRQGLNGY